MTVTRIPMSTLTTLGLGGTASVVKPDTPDALCTLLGECKAAGTPVLLLGKGSKLLVRDGGVDGLVISTAALTGVVWNGACVTALAGTPLPSLALAAADRGLSGLEFSAGIPATVGGAVVMNAGAYGSSIANVVVSAEVCDGERRVLTAAQCGFAYRTSRLQKRGIAVLAVTLRLTPCDTVLIGARTQEYREKRAKSQPQGRTAGSMFQNPDGHAAARLLQDAGLRGLRVGGITVSPRHANFMVNLGGTARDAEELLEACESRVSARFGITLRREIIVTGTP